MSINKGKERVPSLTGSIIITIIVSPVQAKNTYCGGDGCTVCVCDYHAKKGCAARASNNQTKHDSLSVIISRTRQTSSVINEAINQSQIISNLESHSQ